MSSISDKPDHVSTLAILERLIAFPTVSRDPNRALIDYVRDFLIARGYDANLVLAEDGRKANLFATIGPKDVPGVMLSGHTDVVPVDGQAWTSDPFKLLARDQKYFGRGTADMKGFLAACLSLIDRASGRKLKTPIHLSFSHDEEIGCIGVRSLIDKLAQAPLRPRCCIVGEPTLMKIATGHKGKINGRATCCGVESHSALAPNGLNAIHLACDFIGRLRYRQAEIVEKGARDDDYDIPYTTIHAGVINGGTALNIVPNQCKVDFEIRDIAEDDAHAIFNLIRADADAIAARERPRFPAADIKIEVVNEYPGLATAEQADVVKFVREITGAPKSFKVAFGTEGGLFTDRLGIPTVICGPGSMDQGHKPDEFISGDQLAACDAMMDRLLDKLAA